MRRTCMARRLFVGLGFASHSALLTGCRGALSSAVARHSRLCVRCCKHEAEVMILQVQPICSQCGIQSSAALLWCPRECLAFSSISSSIIMWFWTPEECCSNTPLAQRRPLTKWHGMWLRGPNCATAAAGYGSGISAEMKSADPRSILTQPKTARHKLCTCQIGRKLNRMRESVRDSRRRERSLFRGLCVLAQEQLKALTRWFTHAPSVLHGWWCNNQARLSASSVSVLDQIQFLN